MAEITKKKPLQIDGVDLRGDYIDYSPEPQAPKKTVLDLFKQGGAVNVGGNMFTKERGAEGIGKGLASGSSNYLRGILTALTEQLPKTAVPFSGPSGYSVPSGIDLMQGKDPLSGFKDLLKGVEESNKYTEKFYKGENFTSLLGNLAKSGTVEDLQRFTDYTSNVVAQNIPQQAVNMAGALAGVPAPIVMGLAGLSAGGSKYSEDLEENPQLNEAQRLQRSAISGTSAAATEGIGFGLSKLAFGGKTLFDAIPEEIKPVLMKSMGKSMSQVMGKVQRAVGANAGQRLLFNSLVQSLGEGSEEVADTLVNIASDEHYAVRMYTVQEKLTAMIEAFGIGAIASGIVGSPLMAVTEIQNAQDQGTLPTPEELFAASFIIKSWKNGIPGSQNPENQIHVSDADIILLESKIDSMIQNKEWDDSEGDNVIMELVKNIRSNFQEMVGNQRGQVINPFYKEPSKSERIKELREKSYQGALTEEEASELKQLKESITLPVEAIEGTGETKIRGLSANVQSEAVRKGLEQGFGDLPEYKQLNMKDQAQKASELLSQDFDRAKRIALGEEKAPEGILPESIFVAVENKATEENDYYTLMELATQSKLTTEATTMGQRIRTLAERNAESAIGAMKSIMKSREEAIERRGGSEPSEEQKLEIERLKQKLTDTEQEFENYKKKMADRSKPYNPRFGAKNTVFTKEMAEQAQASLKAKIMGLRSGIDPTAIKEITQIGGFYFEGGLRNFAEWSGKMVEDFGDKIKPFLNEAWKNIKDTFDQIEKQKVLNRINELVSEGKRYSEIGFQIQKLAEMLVAEGADTREKLVNKMHEILKNSLPEITKREVSDAISGYGRYKPLSKDKVKAKLRDIKGQLQQIAKLEDLQSKKAPLKTGVERRVPSAEERALIKQVEEAKKKYNIETADPAKELKSALDAVKTRLNNQIEDLKKQIDAKQKTVKEKYATPEDAETRKLRDERDALKEKFNEIFGKPSLTDEQRVKIALKSAEKSIEEYQRKIDEKDFYKKQISKTPQTPELEILWTVRDLIKEEYRRLKESAFPKKSPEERALQALKNRLARRAVELQERLDSLDFTKKEKKIVERDPEAVILEAKKEALKMAYDVANKYQATISKEEAEDITKLAKQVAEKKSLIKPDSPKGSQERLNYGRALFDFLSYVAEVKKSSQKITWEDFKKRPFYSALMTTAEVSGMFKALKSTGDFSMILGQGFKASPNYFNIWLKNSAQSFVDFVKTFGKENVEREIKADILSRPNAVNGIYKKFKLDVYGNEEMYPTSWPEKIPFIGTVFKGFENSFTGFIQKMRADIFDYLYEVFQKSGAETEGLGILVNSLMGRGTLPMGLERASGIINKVMFAGKYLMSDVDFLLAHLNTQDFTTQEKMSPKVRLLAGKHLATTVLATAIILFIAYMINPESVEEDPTSSDFGSIKIGNTRFKVTRLTNIITLAMRLIKNETTASTGKIVKLNTGQWGSKTRMEVIGDFFQNRLSPLASIVNDVWLRGTDFRGENPTVKKIAENAVAPFPVSSTKELLEEPNKAVMLAGLVTNALGISTNTYPGESKEFKALEKEKSKAKFSEDKKRSERKSLVENAFIAIENGVDIKEFQKGMNSQERREFSRSIQKVRNKKDPDALIRSLAFSGSNNQKIAVMKKSFDRFKTEDDLKQFLRESRRKRLFSEELSIQILKVYREQKKD